MPSNYESSPQPEPRFYNPQLFTPEGSPSTELVARMDKLIAASQEMFTANEVQGVYLVGSQNTETKPGSDIDVLVKTATINIGNKAEPRSLSLMGVANPGVDPKVLIGLDGKFHVPPEIKAGFFDIFIRSYGPFTDSNHRQGCHFYNFLSKEWVWTKE